MLEFGDFTNLLGRKRKVVVVVGVDLAHAVHAEFICDFIGLCKERVVQQFKPSKTLNLRRNINPLNQNPHT